VFDFNIVPAVRLEFRPPSAIHLVYVLYRTTCSDYQRLHLAAWALNLPRRCSNLGVDGIPPRDPFANDDSRTVKQFAARVKLRSRIHVAHLFAYPRRFQCGMGMIGVQRCFRHVGGNSVTNAAAIAGISAQEHEDNENNGRA